MSNRLHDGEWFETLGPMTRWHLQVRMMNAVTIRQMERWLDGAYQAV